MRAIVYEAVGAAPRVAEVPEPICPPDGAVIEVRATGICRSDWHAWRGHDPVPLPHVPGHEFAGEVVAVGPTVRGFTLGDRVTAPFVNGCGVCGFCAEGRAQICPDQTQPGFTHAGSFAERVVVRAADTNLVRLPDSVGFVQAAALGCRFATAFRALTGHGPVRDDAVVAVYGCGGVGLSAVLIATALKMRVLAVDPSPAANSMAAALGAVIVHEITEEADIAIDAYGSAATAEASVRALRRGGRHVQVGLMLGNDARAPLPWDLVVARELTVVGSHGMAAADYPPMLDLVARGRLDPGRLVGSVIPLEAAGVALTAMDSPIPAHAGITVASRER
ncbi:alcohol dehydrogenase catalytic domain-containing protein [Actinoplanes sp. LDG1-06]|uniref:Alcohol dehydrogenase catalytic domain-containing protein n=1 Tax=Paractinoplanes ovalisporus TaxID=2810368 RepID=A0ABS2AU52_9ACTN|nr:alcohol dehydrogenase catalytic domain-containing protein [Actinoplanes ovalisporus]MBM2623341.1 alcohol dehydrogenase catalytic domain-containing protein [Actinoplanes ovalisporus]